MRRLAGGLTALVLAAAPAAVLALTSNPNDPYYTAGYQWALSGNPSSTNAPQAWCVSTGSGILIADIDTGVDFGHPDLQGKLVAGAAFVNGNANPGPNPQPDATGQSAVMDDYGHGTMTTGIMVAGTNNGYGMAAEAPGARALVMKVFSNKGGSNGYSAYDSDVAAAVYWAVQHGAQVVNLSLGPVIPLPSSLTGDPIPGAVQWAASQGVGVAIASGNGAFDSGFTLPGRGANYTELEPYALVVGAMGHSGNLASYSQTGNIYAPGGDGGGGSPSADILSTYPTYTPSNPGLSRNVANAPFALYDGTSFATPYAAATLALLMSHGMSAAQARSRILASTRNVGGRPVLDARAALGGCPTSGGGGGGGGGGASGGGCCPSSSSGPASTVQAPTTTKPAASPSAAAQPSASPSAAAAQAADAPGARPATIHTQAVQSAPRGLLISLAVIAGLLAAAGLAWFIRARTFPQP